MKKNLLQLVCGNAIAEIGEIFFFLAIVAMPLPKMEGKKKIMVAEIWGGIKKKKKCYIHNILQQIIGD